jgi:sugar lactone lactonase YvrE
MRGFDPFYHPEGLAVDGADNVIVVNNSGFPVVEKFAAGGFLLNQWGNGGVIAPGAFNSATGTAVDGNGNIYVLDSDNGRIQVLDGSGNYLTQWGTAGSAPGQFLYPRGIAIDGAGYIYVADSGNNRIQKFAPIPGLAPRAPVVTAPATFSGAEGTALSINVTASDPDGDAITSLTAAGTAITAGAVFTAGAGKTTGTLTWTPTYTQAGSYSVTFTASNALSGSATTAITIANTNLPPVVTISAWPAL